MILEWEERESLLHSQKRPSPGFQPEQGRILLHEAAQYPAASRAEALRPPSTRYSAPVMERALSEQR